jgi:hypothetical protein
MFSSMGRDMFTTPSWLLYVAFFFAVYFGSAYLASRRDRDANTVRNHVVAPGSIWLYTSQICSANGMNVLFGSAAS